MVMETGNHLEPSEGWGGEGGEEWARLQSLLELVRRENYRTELSPERREQIRERLLERLERDERRRRRARAIVAGASAALFAGLVLALVVRARAA
jgi:hypothetical protein